MASIAPHLTPEKPAVSKKHKRSLEPTEPERVSRWKSQFNRYYGMPFSSIVEIIDTLPDTVVEVMNRRASVQRMKVWRKGYNQGRRITIIRLADKYIQRFGEKGASGLADESMKHDFRMLENTWYTVSTKNTEYIAVILRKQPLIQVATPILCQFNKYSICVCIL